MKKCKFRKCQNKVTRKFTYCESHRFHLQFQGRELNREKVRARDNYTCQKCGKIWNSTLRRFDTHHLNGLCGKMSRKYDREIKGLITYCHKCHMSLHSNVIKYQNARKIGFYKTTEGLHMLLQMDTMRKAGWSFDKIADELGLKEPTVFRQLAKYRAISPILSTQSTA